MLTDTVVTVSEEEELHLICMWYAKFNFEINGKLLVL